MSHSQKSLRKYFGHAMYSKTCAINTGVIFSIALGFAILFKWCGWFSFQREGLPAYISIIFPIGQLLFFLKTRKKHYCLHYATDNWSHHTVSRTRQWICWQMLLGRYLPLSGRRIWPKSFMIASTTFISPPNADF